MALTTESGGERKRLKRKIVATIVGICLLVAGSAGLFWNEWRSASRTATLLAGEWSVVSLDVESVPTVLPRNLVHLAGQARGSAPIADALFPVRSDGLRLDRTVEMYQWREHREGSGNDRGYRYEPVWAEGRISSERFRAGGSKVNPSAPSVASERRYPAEVTIGAFRVAPAMLDLLPASEVVTVTGVGEVFVGGEPYQAAGAIFGNGRISTPQIGDVRIRFRAVPAGPISVLGGVDGSVIDRWTAPNGKYLALASPGLATADKMLAAAYRSNALATWRIRLAATLVVFVGLALFLPRFDRLFPRFPAFRTRLQARFVLPLGLTMAIAWALAVVAMAWVVFRPMLSFGLIIASVALLALFVAIEERRPRASKAREASEPR